MSIVINNLSKYYNRQKALDNISFSLNKGEICGFLGPNGAGKSTTMRIITGYLGEYEGDVSVCDMDIRTQALKTKAKIGYLPEHNPLYPEMYIKEYLLYVARLYKTADAPKRVEEIIELTGLVPERKKKIGLLSKGYRQRVGLAQALVHDPEVLILDEPMTGLDPNQLEEIRNLITRIGKDKTVMLSTHVMQEVDAICDRIIIIDKGLIVADKPKSVLHNVANQTLIEVSFAKEISTQWLSEIQNIESILPTHGNSYQLTIKAGTDPRIELFKAAATQDCPIIELRMKEQNLEEIFKQLTHK